MTSVSGARMTANTSKDVLTRRDGPSVSSVSGVSTPQVLVPFDKREIMTLRDAAKLAGKSEGTVRKRCELYHIGRRVAGGPWCVSRVALAMLLDGNADTLAAYLAGDRHGPLVAPYFERLGLCVLLRAEPPERVG